MTTCPKCGAPVEGPFGLLNCQSCDALLTIDLDGNVSFAGGDEPAAEAAGEPTQAIPTTQPGVISTSEQPTRIASPEELLPEITPAKSQASFGSGLDEVARYGNSEVSKADDGVLSFDVTIEGIDSRELRESVLEALDDSRFVWDAQALMKTIRSGKLRLVDLNPVKASVLINRMKALPVSVSWEQHEITRPS